MTRKILFSEHAAAVASSPPTAEEILESTTIDWESISVASSATEVGDASGKGEMDGGVGLPAVPNDEYLPPAPFNDAYVDAGLWELPRFAEDLFSPLPNEGETPRFNGEYLYPLPNEDETPRVAEEYLSPLPNKGETPRWDKEYLSPLPNKDETRHSYRHEQGQPQSQFKYLYLHQGLFDPPLPYVVVEKHDPKVNDMMTGAMDPRDSAVSESMPLPGKNIMSTHSYDLSEACVLMPYKVISMKDLRQMLLPVRDYRILNSLPDDLLTTFRGLDRAIDHLYLIHKKLARGGPDPMKVVSMNLDWDRTFITALSMRSGSCKNDVVYPEDIVPTITRETYAACGIKCEGEGVGEGSGAYEYPDPEATSVPQDEDMRLMALFGQFDDEYWGELQEQGAIWDEIDLPVLE